MEISEDEPFKDFDDFELTAINEVEAASTSGQEESARPKAQKRLAFENQHPTASTKKTLFKKTVVNPEQQSVKTISVKVEDPTRERLGSENLQSQSSFSSDGIAETNTVSPIKYTYRVQEKTVFSLPDKIATRVVSKQWVEATCLSLRGEKFK